MNQKYQLDQVSIRMVKEPPLLSKTPMDSPEAAVRVLADTFRDYDREIMGVVHLRTDNVPINMVIASMGSLNYSLAHPRELLKAAFLSNAPASIRSCTNWSVSTTSGSVHFMSLEPNFFAASVPSHL